MKDPFPEAKHIHCIGIGGIGISALARMVRYLGKDVSGTDSTQAELTDKLKRERITVHIGHDVRHILKKKPDLVIYSAAISQDNPELRQARESEIRMMTYPEALGEVTKLYKTIAISGTHGKTTTTAMVAHILEAVGMSPTVIIGSLLKSGTNFVAGESDILVIEADEYRRAFSHYTPFIAAITNIDVDHLDYYKDISDIQSAFYDFVSRVPDEGGVVANCNDQKVWDVFRDIPKVIYDFSAVKEKGIRLAIPGIHNIRNAQCAIKTCEILGVSQEDAKDMLKGFEGTWRRAEYRGKTGKGALVFDDYAHHPTEIHTTLEGFREKYPDVKITVIFQPHLYSRTKKLLNEFATSFTESVDEVILVPIYAAREENDPDISSDILSEKIADTGTPSRSVSSFEDAIDYISSVSGKNDVLITMGAGDVYHIADELTAD